MKKYIPSLLVAVGLIGIVGCAEYQNYTPTISEPTRAGLKITPPVLISVFDGRGNREGNQRPDQSIKAGILSTYPDAIQLVDYFTQTPQGRIRIKIRIQELGSQFGSRVVSSSSIVNQYGQATALATDGWNSVVANAYSQQTSFGSSIATEGWWIGTAWIEVNIEDKRNGRKIDFTFPLVSEQKESNMWGYGSANAATKRAWSRVSAQLFSTIDNVLIKASNKN
jgi:hypothetical protein